MKWIGQHIWDFISRFRNTVYLEYLFPSASTTVLVVDPDGKVGTNGGIGAPGVDSVTVGPAAVSTGIVTTITPNVGSVIVIPNAYAGTTNVGHVPIGGGATTFLRGDGTWVTPTGAVTSVSAIAPVASIGTPLVITPTTGLVTVQSRSYAGGASVGHVPSGSGADSAKYLNGVGGWTVPTGTGVTTFTNANGTFISAGTVNTGATGAVTVGTIDLSAGGVAGATTFLRGDNTWAVPSYTPAYTLPVATATTLGGVELGSNTALTQAYEAGVTGTASRTYPVQLNAGRQMAVSVPWTDTPGAVIDVDETAPGTSTGTPIVVNPTTGNVLVQSMAYNGGINVGHVPTGGSAGKYLDGATGAWITLPAAGVTTVTTTDGTFIDLTPNAPTGGAVTVTADLSATGTPSATTFLRGDNVWATPSSGILESTQSGGSGKQTSWLSDTYLIPKKNGGNFLNTSNLNINFSNAVSIDQIIACSTGQVYCVNVVFVCDEIEFPEGCHGDVGQILIGVIKDPMVTNQSQFNYTFTSILTIPLPQDPGNTSVICEECTVDVDECDAWTFAAFFACEAEEPVALNNVYIWCTLNKHTLGGGGSVTTNNIFWGVIINWAVGSNPEWVDWGGILEATATHNSALPVPFDCIIKKVTMKYLHTNVVNVSADFVYQVSVGKLTSPSGISDTSNLTILAFNIITLTGSAGGNNINGTYFYEESAALALSVTAGDVIVVQGHETAGNNASGNKEEIMVSLEFETKLIKNNEIYSTKYN